MDTVRTLKANLKLEGKPCGWCRSALQLGEDAALCTACERAHHQRCWERRAGCSDGGCVSAPLPQLEPAAAGVGGLATLAELAPGMMRCPSCRNAIPIGDALCSVCRSVTSPDGIYHGPKTNAPGAVASLVYGIVGLFICGVIFGPVAIARANAAKRGIAENVTYTGGGMATAGMVLGILDLVIWALLLISRVGASGT